MTPLDQDRYAMNTQQPKYQKNTDGEFVCPYCKVVKKKQNTMHYHIRREHEQDFPHECKLCVNKPKFLQRSSFLHHLATNHPDNPHPNEKDANQYAAVQYKCPSCDHSTHTKSNIVIHNVRTHCPWIPAFVKDTPCTSCNRSFRSSSAYLYHAHACFVKQAPANSLEVPTQENMLSRSM